MQIVSSIKAFLPKDPKIRGMFYFMVVIALTHFLWKLVITGNIHGHEISFLGIDVSPFFYDLSVLTAKISWWTLNSILGHDFTLVEDRIFMNEYHSVRIIWACTAVKQFYMFICLIMFYPDVSWLKKIAYIVLGCVALEVFNIFRIDIVVVGTKNNPAHFDAIHSFTQYIFYVVMFLLWLFWLEKIAVKNEKK